MAEVAKGSVPCHIIKDILHWESESFARLSGQLGLANGAKGALMMTTGRHCTKQMIIDGIRGLEAQWRRTYEAMKAQHDRRFDGSQESMAELIALWHEVAAAAAEEADDVGTKEPRTKIKELTTHAVQNPRDVPAAT